MAARRTGIASWFRGSPKARVPNLGVRELKLLECLWRDGQSSTKDVVNALAPDTVTLSTVQSTMERLYRKGLLSRVKCGRAYTYAATLSRSQLISRLLRGIADELAGGELAPMVSGFAEYAAAETPEFETQLVRWLAREDRKRD